MLGAGRLRARGAKRGERVGPVARERSEAGACAGGVGPCGEGEKAGPRWAVQEGKKGETAWAVRGLGLGRFGLKGWFLGWV